MTQPLPGSVRVEWLRPGADWSVMVPVTNRPAAQYLIAVWRRRGWAASRFRIVELCPLDPAPADSNTVGAVQESAPSPVPCRRSDAGEGRGYSEPNAEKSAAHEGSAEA